MVDWHKVCDRIIRGGKTSFHVAKTTATNVVKATEEEIAKLHKSNKKSKEINSLKEKILSNLKLDDLKSLTKFYKLKIDKNDENFFTGKKTKSKKTDKELYLEVLLNRLSINQVLDSASSKGITISKYEIELKKIEKKYI